MQTLSTRTTRSHNSGLDLHFIPQSSLHVVLPLFPRYCVTASLKTCLCVLLPHDCQSLGSVYQSTGSHLHIPIHLPFCNLGPSSLCRPRFWTIFWCYALGKVAISDASKGYRNLHETVLLLRLLARIESSAPAKTLYKSLDTKELAHRPALKDGNLPI